MVARSLKSLIACSICALFCAVAATPRSAASVMRFGAGGEESGQLRGAWGIAVDNAAAGDVYVPDFRNYRMDRFDSSGSFLTAWGWGVDEEGPAHELQICTNACQAGVSGFGSGQASDEGFQGVAVDNNPLSVSYGDVYVVDFDNARVQKFTSSGEFVLMFGGDVNETKDNTSGASETEKDVCVAGEKCTHGVFGSGNGQFEWAYRANGIVAVGPEGRVYVGDRGRVEVFEASGVWRESVSLAGLSSTGKVTALAVDPAGDMFLKDSGAPGVRELEPSGAEKPAQLDAGSTSVEAIALDASGDVFVADPTGGFRVIEYGASGEEVASFAAKTASQATGMAFSDALGELYMSTGFEDAVWAMTPPAPGPLVLSGSESATPGLRGAATLEAAINPEGAETSYRFEYVSESQYQSGGFAGASRTGEATLGSNLFEDQQVSASLTGLVPGETYHYRVVATNAHGAATGADATFQSTPPALVEGPWATGVAGTSATLAASVNPLGAATEVRIEYGTSSAYGHTLAANAGEGMGYVPIAFHVQGLEPHTTYHYRVAAVNEVGTVEGADHAFTTQPQGSELALPDGRTWELVSPPDKQGAIVAPMASYPRSVQAAVDGSGITYPASGPIGEGERGHITVAQALSARTATGWRTQDISEEQGLPPEGEAATELFEANESWYLFSNDLSGALLEQGAVAKLLSPEATEKTLYLRHNDSGSFQPLVTAANVPAGTKFGQTANNEQHMLFLAGTPDLGHVILGTEVALTPEAQAGAKDSEANLYEWSDGRLQLVNILPNGETHPGASLGSNPYDAIAGMTARAISDDGRWVVFVLNKALYVRDMVAKRTVQLKGVFETMSGDGAEIFYRVKPSELYALDTATGASADLTQSHGPGERSAGVQEAVMGVSQDGSYVYFIATGALASGARSGEDNLYVLHENAGRWATTYVTTLSKDDEKSWFAHDRTSLSPVMLPWVSSRVSPNGRFVTFMSDRPLTGYDNIDALSGQPVEEVYLYDAVANRISCVSCNPSGARPVGLLDHNEGHYRLADIEGAWTAVHSGSDHLLGGSLPGWNRIVQLAPYQPRFLSSDGRLFFDSPDALVPQDINGVEDTYEYEPQGVGSCTTSSTTFVPDAGGCVSLISSGTAAGESVFMDASESGGDVFFATPSKLTAEDYDRSYDIYDAHVCSAALPCRATPVVPPPCVSGDSCKAAPSPQPELFGAAPSATFSGTGNVRAPASVQGVKRRSAGTARKLAQALRACRKRHGHARKACERKARKRYRRATSARNAKAMGRGRL